MQNRKKWRRAGYIVSLMMSFSAAAGLGTYQYRDIRNDITRKTWVGKYELPSTHSSISESGKTDPDESAEIAEMSPESDEKQPSDPLLRRSFDFAAMQAANPDIIAWITIPGTVIDYPVCRHTDNQYYLKHNASGEKDTYGAIFADPETDMQLIFPLKATESERKYFPWAHIILYGHNMRSGRMFGCLKQYRSSTFLRDHPCFYLYTPYGSVRARIFSCFEASPDGIAYQINLESSEECTSWLNEISRLNETELPDGTDFATGCVLFAEEDSSYGFLKPCITLSTCVSGSNPDRRFTIHAVPEEVVTSEENESGKCISG